MQQQQQRFKIRVDKSITSTDMTVCEVPFGFSTFMNSHRDITQNCDSLSQ